MYLHLICFALPRGKAKRAVRGTGRCESSRYCGVTRARISSQFTSSSSSSSTFLHCCADVSLVVLVLSICIYICTSTSICICVYIDVSKDVPAVLARNNNNTNKSRSQNIICTRALSRTRTLFIGGGGRQGASRSPPPFISWVILTKYLRINGENFDCFLCTAQDAKHIHLTSLHFTSLHSALLCLASLFQLFFGIFLFLLIIFICFAFILCWLLQLFTLHVVYVCLLLLYFLFLSLRHTHTDTLSLVCFGHFSRATNSKRGN